MILGASESCRKISQMLIKRKQDPEYLALGKPYEDLIKQTVALTGAKWAVDWTNFHSVSKINFFFFWKKFEKFLLFFQFFDLLKVQNDNGRLNLQWIKDNFAKIEEVSNKAQYALYTRDVYIFFFG